MTHEWVPTASGDGCNFQTSKNREFNISQNARGVFIAVNPTNSPDTVVSSCLSSAELDELIIILVEAKLKYEGICE